MPCPMAIPLTFLSPLSPHGLPALSQLTAYGDGRDDRDHFCLLTVIENYGQWWHCSLHASKSIVIGARVHARD